MTELDAASKETVEVPARAALMRKSRSGRADVPSGELAQSLQNGGNAKLRVLAQLMSSNADKLDFGNEALSRSRQFEPHGFCRH
jgi:hypothetical protein